MEYFDKRLLHLDRIEFAGIQKKDLMRNKWRFLTPKEVGYLKMIKSIEEHSYMQFVQLFLEEPLPFANFFSVSNDIRHKL